MVSTMACGTRSSGRIHDADVSVNYRTFTKIFSQPMCSACIAYSLDYSSIQADLHYIMNEECESEHADLRIEYAEDKPVEYVAPTIVVVVVVVVPSVTSSAKQACTRSKSAEQTP